MSDPLRTDGSHALTVASEADRDAKIEQLLLVGLDHYFASQYEQAINVWTRALFLDRGHVRARAYIERARSALAERQRESEELLQKGVAAFHGGDVDESRRLLRAAIDGGAPPEEALALLDRLNRLSSGANVQPPLSSPGARRVSATGAVEGWRPPLRTALYVAPFIIVAAAAVAAVFLWKRQDWRSWLGLEEIPAAAVAAPVVKDVALPLPRRSEMALARARALAAGGHLRDALIVLDAVRPTDPEKAAADRLRSDIQHELLALASTAPGAGSSEQANNRQP